MKRPAESCGDGLADSNAVPRLSQPNFSSKPNLDDAAPRYRIRHVSELIPGVFEHIARVTLDAETRAQALEAAEHFRKAGRL